jgi:hypothetical protein
MYSAALEQHGDMRLADRFEQIEILHVARTDLEHVDRLAHALDLIDAHHFAHDRHTGFAARFR